MTAVRSSLGDAMSFSFGTPAAQSAPATPATTPAPAQSAPATTPALAGARAGDGGDESLAASGDAVVVLRAR